MKRVRKSILLFIVSYRKPSKNRKTVERLQIDNIDNSDNFIEK